MCAGQRTNDHTEKIINNWNICIEENLLLYERTRVYVTVVVHMHKYIYALNKFLILFCFCVFFCCFFFSVYLVWHCYCVLFSNHLHLYIKRKYYSTNKFVCAFEYYNGENLNLRYVNENNQTKQKSEKNITLKNSKNGRNSN